MPCEPRAVPDALYAAVFDALPQTVALIDAQGRIVAVNASWRRFAADNGGSEDAYLGWNYLEACRHSRGDGAQALARSLEELLAGERAHVDYEYPCHGPTRRRWFLMHAACLPAGDGTHAIVAHVNITRRRIAEMDAARRADRDELTGLLNRGSFRARLEESVERARRASSRVAVLFVDLDDFKRVNDEHGHRVGDAVLEAVGGRLGRGFRADDAVARYGGDEFVLFVEEGGVHGTFGRVAERLHECLASPIPVGSESFDIRASIGVSLYPDQGSEVDALVFAADEAMYRAKRKGPGHTVFAGDPA